MNFIEGNITAPKGFKASGVRCGIKTEGPDVALVFSEKPATAAGVFTLNLVKAAPVLLSQKHLAGGTIRAIIANAGNANACTGEKGNLNAEQMCQLAAKELGIDSGMVLVCSTGVIGQALPMDKLERGIPEAVETLSYNGGTDAAHAIMTTDRKVKQIAYEFEINGKPVRIGGIAKGSGMICPNMATMLAFITTDATIDNELLQRALAFSVAKSFNSVTVDGDGSTNDTVLLLANGASEAPAIQSSGKAFAEFCQVLDAVCVHLAREIAGDGEGATKLVTVTVQGARSEHDASIVARTIANSNLVKTAFFGNDPNWGRILAAAGRSGIQFDPKKVTLWLCGTKLVEAGEPLPFNAAEVSAAMKAPAIETRLSIGDGQGTATMWTCDLSYDYVRINAEYHT